MLVLRPARQARSGRPYAPPHALALVMHPARQVSHMAHISLRRPWLPLTRPASVRDWQRPPISLHTPAHGAAAQAGRTLYLFKSISRLYLVFLAAAPAGRTLSLAFFFLSAALLSLLSSSLAPGAIEACVRWRMIHMCLGDASGRPVHHPRRTAPRQTLICGPFTMHAPCTILYRSCRRYINFLPPASRHRQARPSLPHLCPSPATRFLAVSACPPRTARDPPLTHLLHYHRL